MTQFMPSTFDLLANEFAVMFSCLIYHGHKTLTCFLKENWLNNRNQGTLYTCALCFCYTYFSSPQKDAQTFRPPLMRCTYTNTENIKTWAFCVTRSTIMGKGLKIYSRFSLINVPECDQGMSVCPEDILTATHRLWKKTLEERRNNIIEVLSIPFSGFCLVPEINVYCRVMLFSFTVGFRYVINFPVFLHFVCRWCQILAIKCTRLLRNVVNSFSHKQRRWNVPLQSSRSQTEVLWSLGVRESLLSGSIK